MSHTLTPFHWQGERQSNFYVDQAGTLYFKKGHEGRKIKFSCKMKSDNFVKAKRFANQKFSQLIGKKKVVVRTLIKDELKNWLRVKEGEDLKYDTLNNIRRAAKQIDWFWANQFPSDINDDNVAIWFAWWAANHGDIDMENAIKYMRVFCKYLSRKVVSGTPLLVVIPAIKDPNYKKIRRRRKKKKENIFSHDDFKKIMSTAPSERDKLVILIMYTMATRITETLSMRWGQEVVRNDEGQWTYRWSDGQNKANLDGWHVFHPKVQKVLSKAEDKGNLFPQALDQTKPLKEQQIDWAEWRERAGLAFHWTPHTFRHTCLSNLFNDAKNPQALICILYRVSLATAMATYIKPTRKGREKMATAIRVDF